MTININELAKKLRDYLSKRGELGKAWQGQAKAFQESNLGKILLGRRSLKEQWQYEYPKLQAQAKQGVVIGPPPGLTDFPSVQKKIEEFKPRGVPLGKLLTAFITEPEEMKTIREKIDTGQPLTPAEKKIANEQQLYMVADIATGLKGAGTKERGFITTARKAERTVPDVAQGIQGTYTPITNKATLAEADKLIKSSFDQALHLAKHGESTAVNNAVSQRLIERLQNAGDYHQAIDLVEALSSKPTSQGQAIQILSYWGKLNPTGALRTAQRLIDKANVGKTGRFLKLDEVTAKRITDLAKQVQKLPESKEKLLKTAELVDEIHGVVPPTLLRKISTIQTMAQLLNPKTAIRNLLGNLGFMGGEAVSQTVATPIDLATSLATGRRTTTLPSVRTQARAFGLGLREGVEEALRGVDTLGMGKQFELGSRQVFTGKYTGPTLGRLEKVMSVELKATDRAFYKAAYQDSLTAQMRLAKVTEATPEMLEKADAIGRYRTFQDNSLAAQLFSGLKQKLNFNKDFGLGDIVLKYPRTPGNLLSRGLDYSPVGFIKTVYKMAEPLLMGKAFNQKEFVDSFSRALVGSGGLITTGVILHRMGIITGKQEADKDISAVQRASGLGQYRINVSALKRFVLSFNPTETKARQGDLLVSYDWFQPQAIGLSMGANIDENGGKATSAVSTLLASLQGGTETLAEQPLVKGFTRLFQGYSAPESLIETAKGIPASFVPTLSSQIAQVTDPTARNISSPDYLTEMLNLGKAKIPGLAQTLPEKFDVWGQPQERYQGGNNWFNVFLNPAFVSRLKESPEGKEVLDIYERSGETQQAPRVAPKSVKINGETKQLTGEDQGKYQQYVGQKAQVAFSLLVQSPAFQAKSDEDKASQMAKVLTDINSAAKIELFGNKPKTLSSGTKMILEGKSFKEIGAIEEMEAAGETRRSQEQTAAEGIWNEIKNLPLEEQKKKIGELQNQGVLTKAIFEKLQDLQKEEARGWSAEEKRIYNLSPIEEARFYFEKLMEMTPEQQTAYINDLQSRGLLTRPTLDELIKLKKSEQNQRVREEVNPGAYLSF